MAFNHDRQRLAPPWIPPATGRANRSRRVILVDRRKVFDTDAAAYIAAVEAADGQALETGVRSAINTFVFGCKADGIWSAIKASCILAGARTLTGALVPLVGTAPTNNNFVSGDYNRKTGLAGNGSTKFVNTNRNSNADPQDNQSMGVEVNTAGTATGTYMGSGGGTTSGTTHFGIDRTSLFAFFRSRAFTTATTSGAQTATGFIGMSRASSTAFSSRINESTQSNTVTSQTTAAGNIYVFGRNVSNAINAPTNVRIRFYWVGEALDLALLNGRVTTLLSAYNAAIP
jgi:hypothetical protein